MENERYVTLDLENETVQGTIQWCQINPWAWARLQRLALAKARNHERRIGARALVERMRWDFERVSIPNVYVTVIARLLEICYPHELKGLFLKSKSDVDKVVYSIEEKAEIEYKIFYGLKGTLC